MKQHIAVVKWEGNKIAKYQDFDIQTEADAHVATYGGFVVPAPGGSTSYWIVDEVAKTVVNDQVKADADSLASSWAFLRTDRNVLLVSSDWTQTTDSPLADAVKADWTVYRQELRDLPTTTDDPVNPAWPTKPAGD